MIESNNINQIKDDVKRFFKTKKIIVTPDEYDDFIYDSKIKYSLNSYNANILSLAIIPTIGCNFDCSYCFEERKQNLIMSNDVIDNLIAFIKDHVNARKLSITWYGGEPLMGFTAIKKIFSSIKEKVSIPILSQSLITNGYLLDENKILYFREIGLNSMQITLDGTKNTHDRYRKLKGSTKGSYDAIINNIDRVMAIFPECHITIRVNISNNNKEEFVGLYKSLSLRWKSEKVYVYPGFIREDTPDGCSFSSNTLNSENLIDFYKDLKNEGCPLSKFPQKVDKGCMINCINSYLIGPQGEIYKCWNDVTNPDKVIGYINQKNFTNKKLLHSYMLKLSPFDDSSCKECFLFPICSGGCGWYRYRNYFEAGDFNICPYFKEREKLEDLLLLSLQENKCEEGLKNIFCWS